MSELTQRDCDWLWLANSNPSQEFYRFKARFLKRFAYQDGWDVQTIKRQCWGCYGSGEYAKGIPCNRCFGDGIFTTSEIFLQRWILNGRTFHIPEFCSPPHHLRDGNIHNEIEGLIKHAGIDPKVSYRCYLRLLIRHEPMNFYWHILNRIKTKSTTIRWKLAWKWMRLRDKMDLFPATPTDDVPF